ncbi:hypothetical protein Cgig2_032917 [Carnegiea gigantea]|uniref:Uncharacterized protein n=1 Tax=Carnegiea gigantea TaxID=171969 RepID=A0A9Q1QAN3_9CARY|nr:hypothetical protein Cgig2_032917 [Carnegiea gigantea]
MGSLSFLSRGLSKRLPNRLSFIPIRDVAPDGCPALSFDGRHEARPIVKIVPPQVLGLFGGPLDRVNQAKCPSRASQATQFTSCDERAIVVPGHGHNLYRCQLVLVQNLPDHGMQGKMEAVVKGYPVYRYTLGGRLIHGGIWLGNHEGALGSGKWLPGPSCESEQVQAPGNSDPLATISVTGGVRPFCLGTELPGPNDDSGEELVKVPSEDEFLEDWPEAEPDEPD